MDTSWKSLSRVGISLFLLYLAVTHWAGALTLLLRLVAAGVFVCIISCINEHSSTAIVHAPRHTRT